MVHNVKQRPPAFGRWMESFMDRGSCQCHLRMADMRVQHTFRARSGNGSPVPYRGLDAKCTRLT